MTFLEKWRKSLQTLRCDRKSLVWAAGMACILLLVHVFGLAPLMEGNALLRRQQDSQQNLIIKLREKIAEAPGDHLSEGTSRFLVGGLGAQAFAAELDGILQRLEGQGVRMVSFHPMPPQALDNYEDVQVRLTFESGIRGVHAFFKALETSRTPYAMREMQIRSAGTGQRPITVSLVVGALLSRE